MKKPIMLFLCGSSAVGKTSLIDYVNIHHFAEKDRPVKVVNMKARDVRETLGNPSWDYLESSQDEAAVHQMFIMSEYYRKIFNIYSDLQSGELEPAVYMFERSLLDVAGYSRAFGLPYSFVKAQTELFVRLNHMMSDSCNILIYHMQVNTSVDYATEPARPGEQVKTNCANYIVDSIRDMGAANNNPSIRYSGSDFLDAKFKSMHVSMQLVKESRRYFPSSIWT